MDKDKQTELTKQDLTARVVVAILTADKLTAADVEAAHKLVTLAGVASDYIQAVANANVDKLNDGYVLNLARGLLHDALEGV